MLVSNSLLFLLLSQTLFARTFGGSGDDGTYSMALTADGGFLLAGYTAGFGAGNADLMVMKISRLGNLMWAKTIGGPDDDWAYSVIELPDRDIILAGYTRSSGAGGSDLLVARMDSLGNLEWARTFGGPGDERAYSVAPANSGFVVVGYTTSFGSGGADLLILKLSSDGNPEWAKTFGGPGQEWASSVLRASDGSIAAAGYTDSFGDGGADFLIIKLSESGSLGLAMTFGGPNDEWAYSVKETDDGNLALLGYTDGFGSGLADALIAMITPSGTLRWAKSIGGPGNDYAYEAYVRGGTLVILGFTSGFGAGGGDFFAFGMNLSGGLLWARTFGGTAEDQAGSVAITQTGYIALAGSTASFGSGGWDHALLILDAGGNYQDCAYSCAPNIFSAVLFTTQPDGLEDCSLAQGNPTLSVANPMLIFADVCPPAVEEGAIPLRPGISCSPLSGAALFISPEGIPIKIYKADGRLFYSADLKRGENKIGLEAGVYLWKTRNQSGSVVVR
ncbi:MAG: hypothetical protein ABIM88_05430 [candidate division WOR-3 bacterium]